MIRRYWTAVHGRRAPALLDAPGTHKPLKSDAEAMAFALADGAADLSVEEAAYLIGSTYAAMLPTGSLREPRRSSTRSTWPS